MAGSAGRTRGFMHRWLTVQLAALGRDSVGTESEKVACHRSWHHEAPICPPDRAVGLTSRSRP
jgi:hypothetical protein